MQTPIFAFELLSVNGAFWICFWAGLIFAVVSGLMSGVFDSGHADSPHIGGDGGGDAGGTDHGGGAGAMPDFPAIGPVTISTFVATFGGAGLILQSIPLTSPHYVSIPLAVTSAFGGGYVVFVIFSKFLYAQQASSETVQHNMIGQSATVNITIPVDGAGEIVYVAGGGRQNAPARAADGKEIPTGAEVVITKIVGSSFYVKKKSE